MENFSAIRLAVRRSFQETLMGGCINPPPLHGRGVTLALMEYSRTLPADGGPFRPPPPAICQSNGPILDPETAFDDSGPELSQYVAKFYLNVIDDVTGRVKGQFFNICHCLLRRAKQPYQKADGTKWILSKLLLSTLLSLL